MNEYSQSLSGIQVMFDPNRTEVWHSDDRGDWRIAYFDVPVGSRFQPTSFVERVEKEYKSTAYKWRQMLEKEGCQPTTPPHLMPGVFHCPDPEKADSHRRLFIMARVKRVRPEIMRSDVVNEMGDAVEADQDTQVKEFFTQMKGLTDHMSGEDMARSLSEDEKLPAKALQEEEAMEKVRYRLTHRPSA